MEEQPIKICPSSSLRFFFAINPLEFKVYLAEFVRLVAMGYCLRDAAKFSFILR